MNDREATAHALEGLMEEVRGLQMAQAVQRSGLVMLARQLTPGQLESAVRELETMGQAQPDEGWQQGHQSLAGALRLGGTRSVHAPRGRRPEPHSGQVRK